MVFLFFITVCATAQNEKEHPLLSRTAAFAFGARGGATISNLDAAFQNYYSSDTRTGIYLGLVYQLPIARSWFFRPEINFAQQGAVVKHSASDPDQPIEIKRKVKLSYLHLPLKIAYLHNSGFSLQTGPQLSLLLGSSEFDHKDGDIGWVLGASYISKSGLGIEVGYNLGLANITRFENFYDYGTDEKNRVLQIGVVYFFAIAKKR
jgi:hypothetical protein